MKGKNITIFGLGAIGGFIGGNVFAFYKMLHSKRIRKALTDIVADKIETVLYGEECHSPKNNSRVSYSYYHKNKNRRNKSDFVLEDILFGTESDALSVLSSMKEIIINYGCVLFNFVFGFFLFFFPFIDLSSNFFCIRNHCVIIHMNVLCLFGV